MPTIAALTTFTANTQAKAAEVNANFSTIRTTVNTYAAFVDTSATITGAWTFSTAPTISGTMSFGAAVTITTGGLTVSAGGITVTGNSTITGTLNVSSTITGNGSGLTNLPAANITGTLPALDGGSLTNLNASNLASGTVAAGRLPTSYSALTITTVTTDAITSTTGGLGTGTVTVAPNGTYFLSLPSASTMHTATAPAGGTNRFLNVRLGSTDYRITLVPV